MNKQSLAAEASLGASDALARQNVGSPSPRDDPSTYFQNSELNFPAKLHIILDTPGYSDIICWLPHGRAWRVIQPQQFEEKVLPLFFRHGRYASFTRQVNGWGFRRILNGPDYSSYYHKQFLRGKPELCQEMKRPTKEERKSTEIKSPPDFYQMEPLGERQIGGEASSDAFAAAQLPENRTTSQATSDVETLSSLSPIEQYFRLQRELEVLEQRRCTILSQLELLSLSRSYATLPISIQEFLHQSHPVLPDTVAQPIITIQSLFNSNRTQPP